MKIEGSEESTVNLDDFSMDMIQTIHLIALDQGSSVEGTLDYIFKLGIESGKLEKTNDFLSGLPFGGEQPLCPPERVVLSAWDIRDQYYQGKITQEVALKLIQGEVNYIREWKYFYLKQADYYYAKLLLRKKDDSEWNAEKEALIKKEIDEEQNSVFDNNRLAFEGSKKLRDVSEYAALAKELYEEIMDSAKLVSIEKAIEPNPNLPSGQGRLRWLGKKQASWEKIYKALADQGFIDPSPSSWAEHFVDKSGVSMPAPEGGNWLKGKSDAKTEAVIGVITRASVDDNR